MPDESKGPCWPWCKDYLKTFTQQEIARIEAILDEREKATTLLAQTQLDRQASDMAEKYVLRETHRTELLKIQEQITGPLGMELRMRSQEQKGGALDAKLYLVIIGLPLAVSVIIAVVVNIFMAHMIK